MKKLLIVLAFASFSLGTMAQEDPTLKYSVATNSFWSNWFIQTNFTWTAFYSNEEKGLDYSKSPIEDFRRDMGASFAIGKWFTPGIGLRTKVNGIWGKSVRGRSTLNGVQVYDGENECNHIKYWNAQEQTLLNLSNLLCGYSSTRVWNFIPYFGVGIARNCSYNTYELVGSAGVLNTWKLSKRVLLNLDLQANLAGDDFEGQGYWGSGHEGANHDRWFSAELGLTFNLGRTGWDKVPDVDAIKALSQNQIDALQAQLNDANAENARLKNLLANQKPAETPKAVKEFVGVPVTVYFHLDKTTTGPTYDRDLLDVKNLVDVAKEKGANLLVTGYADSATGKADHNQWLSEKRAEQVANEIVKMGFSRDKVSTAAKGGVAILSPINLDRRATVEMK